MSKLSFLDRQIEANQKPKIQDENTLATIPDSVSLNRQVFMEYLRKFPQARRFGFSKKHTKEIEAIRTKYGGSASTIYGLPVQWNVEQTYLGI